MAEDKTKEEIIEGVNFDDLKDDLKTATGVGDDDSKLQTAYNFASQYAFSLLANKEVDPIKLEAVLKMALSEMTILRFNRLEEEGMRSRNQDGESIVWTDDLYKPFDEKIKSAIVNEGLGWDIVVMGTKDNSQSREWVMYIPFLNKRHNWVWQSSEYFIN